MGCHDAQDMGGNDMNDFLEMLISLGRLEDNSVALGIAKLVLDKGEDILTEKQKAVFEKHVISPYLNKTCKLCQCEISLSEAIGAFEENDGYCSSCANMIERDEQRL